MSLTPQSLRITAAAEATSHFGGTLCPRCFARNSAVKDSRPAFQSIRRRRECKSCGHRWTTFEIAADETGLMAILEFDAMLQELEPHELDAMKSLIRHFRSKRRSAMT